jgi:hypothetical protein
LSVQYCISSLGADIVLVPIETVCAYVYFSTANQVFY